jgi:hypothetical protein
LPGSFLASAISSWTFFTGRLGVTSTPIVPLPISSTGVKSLAISKLRFWWKNGAIE